MKTENNYKYVALSPKERKELIDYMLSPLTCNLNISKPKTLPEIKRVVYNSPATIIFWQDGTKTIVKAVNEDFDAEKGFAMAYLKKVFGGRNQYLKYIKDATCDDI